MRGRSILVAPAGAAVLAMAAASGCGHGRETEAPTPATVERLSVTEVPLSTGPRYEAFCQLGQPVAALAGGGFAVVWDVDRFPNGDVALQWLSAEGAPLLTQGGRLIAAGPTREGDSVVVASATGGAFVGFTREGDGRSSQVFVQAFDGVGQPRWPGDGIPAGDGLGPEVEREPHLVADEAGGVFACFQAQGGREPGIRCQHLDGTGRSSWPPSGVLAGGAEGRPVLPRAVSDTQGGLLVFWMNLGSSSRPDAPLLVEGQHLTPSGSLAWGVGGKVVGETGRGGVNGYAFDELGVVPDGKGGAVVAFNDWARLNDPALDVVAQRVSGDGALLWGQGAVVTGAPGSQQHEATIEAGDGGAFVAVSQSRGANASDLSLYRLDGEGRHSWPSAGTPLSDPGSGTLNYAAVGAYDRQRLFAFWTRRSVPGTLEMDVVGAHFAPDGRRASTPATTVVSGAPSGQFTRQAAVSRPTGRLLVVWDDLRQGQSFDQSDVYAALVRRTAGPGATGLLLPGTRALSGDRLAPAAGRELLAAPAAVRPGRASVEVEGRTSP